MPERNLFASFRDLTSAKRCQEALFDAGYDVVQVDDLLPQGGRDPLPHSPLVEWGRQGYRTERLGDKWTSSAAWTDSQTGLLAGAAWILTAVVPEEDGDRVSRIIQDYGGSL